MDNFVDIVENQQELELQRIMDVLSKMPDQLAAVKHVVKTMFNESLYHFLRYGLKYPDIERRTHQEIIDALESETRRKLICVPRGTLKSTIGSIGYPLWLICKDPNQRILIDSEVFANSTLFLREAKAHLVSGILPLIYGNFTGNKTMGGQDCKFNEDEVIIRQRTEKYKEATITCGGIGTIKVGQHYSVIVGDDYSSTRNITTKEQIEKVIRHYRMNTSILEPKGIYAIIGTRYHQIDIIGHILREEIGLDDDTVNALNSSFIH